MYSCNVVMILVIFHEYCSALRFWLQHTCAWVTSSNSLVFGTFSLERFVVWLYIRGAIIFSNITLIDGFVFDQL